LEWSNFEEVRGAEDVASLELQPSKSNPNASLNKKVMRRLSVLIATG